MIIIVLAKIHSEKPKSLQMNFLLNEEQCVKKVKKLNYRNKIHKFFRRCFKIGLLLF